MSSARSLLTGESFGVDFGKFSLVARAYLIDSSNPTSLLVIGSRALPSIFADDDGCYGTDPVTGKMPPSAQNLNNVLAITTPALPSRKAA